MLISNPVLAPSNTGHGGGRGIMPHLLYVLNEKGKHSTISVIDPIANKVTSTLPAGDNTHGYR